MQRNRKTCVGAAKHRKANFVAHCGFCRVPVRDLTPGPLLRATFGCTVRERRNDSGSPLHSAAQAPIRDLMLSDKKSYAETKCPYIDVTVDVIPEVFTFEVGETKWRAVLHGKMGAEGYTEVPVIAYEYSESADILGNPVWLSGGNLPRRLVDAVLMALRSAASA